MAITISERAKELLRNQVPYAGTDLPSSPVLALLQEIVDAVNVVAPQVVSVDITGTLTAAPMGSSQLTADVVTKYEADDSVVWASDDTEVATVDADGMVDAIALGTANITATSVADPSVSDTVVFTVAN